MSLDTDYQDEVKAMRPGTTILFYTDGLIEWRDQTMDGGVDPLLAFVEDLGDLSPRAICDHVIRWRHTIARLEDDVCVLAARLK